MPNPSRVTLKDIARETGYTVNTVSRALKDRPDISAAAKARIRAVAEELGYVYDTVAGSLRSGSTRTIAVILSDISNPFLAIQVKSIELAAMKHGYSTFIINTDEDSAAEQQAILSAYGKKVDGILLCPVQKDEENVRFLQKTGLPFVLIGRHFRGIDTDVVMSDDRKAGRLAGEYLLSKGHREILYIGGWPYISSAADRLEGFTDACRAAGAEIDPRRVLQVDVKHGAGKRAIGEALARGCPFTAVIAYSDMLGMEVRCALLEAMGRGGLAIPIVGFDNIQSRLPLPLEFVSVGMAGDDWGRHAVRLLLKRLQDGEEAGRHKKIVLGVELVEYRFHFNG